jgi:hypothetical protein
LRQTATVLHPARRAWTKNGGFIELFNEIDTDASAGTGDQYMSAAQAVAYALHGSGVKLLCGVVTDSVHDGWRDAAADNGLLDVCDGFSFHSYRSPADEEKLVAIFRNWLASRGAANFPLLITEAGTQSDDWKSSSGQVTEKYNAFSLSFYHALFFVPVKYDRLSRQARVKHK